MKLKFYPPMRAVNFEQKGDRIVYPCALQPKIDGVRCITDGIRFWSRDGNLFPQSNMQWLECYHVLDFLVDGELVLPKATFEDTISAVKRANSIHAKNLRFMAFDAAVLNAPFGLRWGYVQDLFVEDHRGHRVAATRWQLLNTVQVTSKSVLERMHRTNLLRGHEGSIVRNWHGFYRQGRSNDVQKYKPLKDAEFEIVDVLEAKGKDARTPIFVCQVPKSGETFRVRPMGTTSQRKSMWYDRKHLIGKMLTVEYQNLTAANGVPRFPRAKVIRDYE